MTARQFKLLGIKDLHFQCPSVLAKTLLQREAKIVKMVKTVKSLKNEMKIRIFEDYSWLVVVQETIEE